ncbi:MAG: nitrate reductase molybdenum cofactor assembly chaperone [Granulosicoccaceae bacterium]
MRSYKILGLLLTYPESQWLDHLGELRQVLQEEGKVSSVHLAQIDTLIETIGGEDLLDAQERYCDTFDRGKGNCLNLFEHVYGESRDRGQAMSELLDLYRAIGLESTGAELPDYLPLYLEYLSRLDPLAARNSLCDTIEVIAVIEARLRQSDSPYAPIMAALVELSKKKINKKEIDEAAANSPDDRSFEAIDAAWEEAAAFDGEPDTPCPTPAQPGQPQPINFVTNARGAQA